MRKLLVSIAFVVALPCCAHSEAKTSETAVADGPKESKTMQAIRKRAVFDLECSNEQIKVTQIEEGTFMHAATYGATCGEKRVSYLERMGNIIKQ